MSVNMRFFSDFYVNVTNVCRHAISTIRLRIMRWRPTWKWR